MIIESENYAELLIAGNYEQAWQQVKEYASAGRNSLFVYEKILTRAMRHIGDLWENNLITVADEHLASGVCEFIVNRYSAEWEAALKSPASGRARKAMLLCLEGEEHELGLKMVASTFREAGWQVRCYGASLPLEFAMLSASAWKPDLIGLSLSMTYLLPKLTGYIEAFEAMYNRPSVMVGGRLAGLMDLSPYCTETTILIRDLVELQNWIHTEPGQERKRVFG